MVPIHIGKALLACLAFLVILGCVDGFAALLGASESAREQVQYLACAFLLVSFPWIAPWALPKLARAPASPSFADHQAERILNLILPILPDQVPPPKIVILDLPQFSAIIVGRPSKSTLFMSSALLQNTSDFDLQAILAHELGHLVHQHQAQVSLFIAGLFLFKAFFPIPLPLTIAAFIAYLALLRDNERAADRHAGETLGEARLQAMLRHLATLVQESPEQPEHTGMARKLMSHLMTHPTFWERIKLSQARQAAEGNMR